ncbi:MAG TPA: toll/interleukin-1 receptor domain-containing protein [Myxococcaceae bacterium]|nr:toll/interleukin-1 receptor domain-containing protein [Myxococcaceae bacterium]
MKVFISYAHEDKARMLVIAAAVRAAGHDVQADEGFLQVGDDFARKIEAIIAACDACIVLWSEASCRKPWVPAEANFALSHKKRVLSIKIEACSPPLPFSTFHMLDITASDDLGPLLRSLDPAHVAAPTPKRSPWPMRLLGAAVAVVVLSVGAWVAIPALRKPEPTHPPTPQAVDAGQPAPVPTPTPVTTPPAVVADAGEDAGAPSVPPAASTPATAPRADQNLASRESFGLYSPIPANPCDVPKAVLKARFKKIQDDCLEPCDLDHYPLSLDLHRCRACEAARTLLQRCKVTP